MITARILKRGGMPAGFEVSGHSGYGEEGSDIVCAAVSSAVELCESILTDSFGADAEVAVDERMARVRVFLQQKQPETIAGPCMSVLSAFEEHMRGLADAYPENIAVMEVQLND